MDDISKGREVIFEFRPVGNVMKVSAIDSLTLIEVSVQCPVTAGEAVFKQTALRKLEYMLKKTGRI